MLLTTLPFGCSFTESADEEAEAGAGGCGGRDSFSRPSVAAGI